MASEPKKVKVPEYNVVVKSLPVQQMPDMPLSIPKKVKFDADFLLSSHSNRAFVDLLQLYFQKTEKQQPSLQLIPGDTLEPKDANLWL